MKTQTLQRIIKPNELLEFVKIEGLSKGDRIVVKRETSRGSDPIFTREVILRINRSSCDTLAYRIGNYNMTNRLPKYRYFNSGSIVCGYPTIEELNDFERRLLLEAQKNNEN